MNMHPDAAAVLRALEVKAGAGLRAQVESRPWYSSGLAGALHIMRIDAGRAATTRLLAGLSDYEFDLPGRLVADIVGEATTRGIMIEALVLSPV